MNNESAKKLWLAGERDIRINSVGEFYVSDRDFPQTFPVKLCEKCGRMVTNLHDVYEPCAGETFE